MTIKQYQYCIFSWSIKIWAPIFVHPKVVIDLKNDLYSPLSVSWSLWCTQATFRGSCKVIALIYDGNVVSLGIQRWSKKPYVLEIYEAKTVISML